MGFAGGIQPAIRRRDLGPRVPVFSFMVPIVLSFHISPLSRALRQYSEAPFCPVLQTSPSKLQTPSPRKMLRTIAYADPKRQVRKIANSIPQKTNHLLWPKTHCSPRGPRAPPKLKLL